METSYLKTLELDKIIARAAEGCVCKESREKLLALEPQCDPDEVRYALEQTDAINSLLIKNGSPRFGGVEGVSQLAARAVKGLSLIHISEPTRRTPISYAVFCLKKKKKHQKPP